MTKIGVVVSSTNSTALIQVVRTSACGSNCNTCGGSCPKENIIISATHDIVLNKGDIVNVESDTKTVLAYTSLIYIIPLFLMFLGLVISYQIFNLSEISAFLIGLALLFLSYFIIHLYAKDKKITFSVFDVIKKNR